MIFKDMRQIAGNTWPQSAATYGGRVRVTGGGLRLRHAAAGHTVCSLSKFVINYLIQLFHIANHRNSYRLGYAAINGEPTDTAPADRTKLFHALSTIRIEQHLLCFRTAVTEQTYHSELFTAGTPRRSEYLR